MVAGILLQRDAGGDLPASCATTPPRSRRPTGSGATPSPRPPRRASRHGSCSLLPAAAAALAELASPGLLAGLLEHPLSVWLVAMAAVLQATAILAVARLARVR